MDNYFAPFARAAPARSFPPGAACAYALRPDTRCLYTLYYCVSEVLALKQKTAVRIIAIVLAAALAISLLMIPFAGLAFGG